MDILNNDLERLDFENIIWIIKFSNLFYILFTEAILVAYKLQWWSFEHLFNIINGLKNKIIDSKEELKKLLPYGKGGWNMYEDILRLNQNFVKDWGYSFLR